MAAENQNEVVVNNEFEKRIVEAFEIFDHTGNKTIDVREVASVLCSLGKNYYEYVKFHPASAEELLRAFQILDKENNGYMTKEFVTEILTTKGECFTTEELQELIKTASDPYSGLIMYEYYINQIMID